MKPFVVSFVALCLVALRPATSQADILTYNVNLSGPAYSGVSAPGDGDTMLVEGTITFDTSLGDITSSALTMHFPLLSSPVPLPSTPAEGGRGVYWDWQATPSALNFVAGPITIGPTIDYPQAGVEWQTIGPPGYAATFILFKEFDVWQEADLQLEFPGPNPSDPFNGGVYYTVYLLDGADTANSTPVLVGTAAPVPEPSRFVGLIGLAGISLIALVWHRRRAAA